MDYNTCKWRDGVSALPHPAEVIKQISISLYLLRVICSVLLQHPCSSAAKIQALLKILWILLMANNKTQKILLSTLESNFRLQPHFEETLRAFIYQIFLFVSISQFSPGEAQVFHLHESMWWIALPLCTYRKHYETHCTMASMWRNTHIYFWGNGLLYGEWMIKPLIAVLWPEEVLGIDGTFQSSETPTAILHYYWSKAHGTASIPHTNKNSKNTSVPLNTYAAARTQTDQQISSPHVQIHARQKKHVTRS